MRQQLALLFDRFTLALIVTVIIASVLPCRGEAAHVFGIVTSLAIALLFFLHGAKLSREAIIAGITHWRLHLLVLACTFVMFPLLGVLSKPLVAALVGVPLATGFVFLCTLPSTVQSSIAFTSIARGNVPAAVCAASASSLLGIFLTPLLVSLLIHTSGDASVVARQRRARHRAATVRAVRRRADHAALDRRLGRFAQEDHRHRRSRIDPARGLHRVQRGGGRRALASGHRDHADLAARVLLRAARRRARVRRRNWVCASDSIAKTASRFCFADRRKVSPAACRWRTCCSRRRQSDLPCCR